MIKSLPILMLSLASCSPAAYGEYAWELNTDSSNIHLDYDAEFVTLYNYATTPTSSKINNFCQVSTYKKVKNNVFVEAETITYYEKLSGELDLADTTPTYLAVHLSTLPIVSFKLKAADPGDSVEIKPSNLTPAIPELCHGRSPYQN